MTVLPRKRMTVDEFLAWAEGQPGRFELYDGVVYAMSPERARHAEVKHATASALAAAIAKVKAPFWMLPDGMTVRIDADTAHEPDALVYCGGKLPADAIEVPSPIIVVEVLSPSTRHVDASAKLAGYFKLSSVHHYLIVDPHKRVAIHHARGAGDLIATRIARKGTLVFDPPGLRVAVDKLFGEAPR